MDLSFFLRNYLRVLAKISVLAFTYWVILFVFISNRVFLFHPRTVRNAVSELSCVSTSALSKTSHATGRNKCRVYSDCRHTIYQNRCPFAQSSIWWEDEIWLLHLYEARIFISMRDGAIWIEARALNWSHFSGIDGWSLPVNRQKTAIHFHPPGPFFNVLHSWPEDTPVSLEC